MDNYKVLLVDDEKEFVDLLAKRLRSRELEVECVYSGTEALEAVREKKYDIVVLDVKMPGIDGIETLKEIKKSNPEIEVIMLTGHATLDTAVDGMKMDAFDYLEKPIAIENLMDKLKNAFNKRYYPPADKYMLPET